jgi:hypothetical protein
MLIDGQTAVSANLERKLWRYLDLSKLVSLLSAGALWFSRADLLGDPFEGSVTHSDLSRTKTRASLLTYIDRLPPELQQSLKSVLGKIPPLERIDASAYVSSWHENPRESAAMWRLYLRGGDGVAIQTTLRRFAAVLASCPEEILIKKVSYIDYGAETFRERSPYAPYLHKRSSFEHEREIRALTFVDNRHGIGPAGIAISTNTDILIENIFVAPTSADWFLAAVQAVVDRFELSRKVQRSELDAMPLF